MWLRNISVILFLCASANAYSDDTATPVASPLDSATITSESISSDKPTTGLFKTDGWSFSVYAGRYDVSYDPQFSSMRKKYGVGMSASAELKSYRHLALDFEFFYVNRDYDTPVGPPLWGTIDGDTSIQTSSLLFGVRGFLPGEGNLRIYASTGLGLFRTQMVVTGSVLGFPGVYEDTDTSVNPYLGLGLSYHFHSWGLSLDVRRFQFTGDFPGFNISHAELGGTLYLLGWQFLYKPTKQLSSTTIAGATSF